MKSFPSFNQTPWEWKSGAATDTQAFSDMPFTKLLDMLSYKLIRRSPQLTDLLLKLLAHLSPQLPEEDPRKSNEVMTKQAATSPTSTTKNVSEQTSTTTTMTTGSSGSASNNKIATPFYSHIFSHFKILIEVLTHKCGTNEGLENIARIIQNICQCSYASNVILSQYLRHAILGLAGAVQKEIKFLLEELQTFTKENLADIASRSTTMNTIQGEQGAGGMGSSFISNQRTMQTDESPPTLKTPGGSSQTTNNGHLPSQITAIKLLMSSSSAQVYFLRTLKIFLSVNGATLHFVLD